VDTPAGGTSHVLHTGGENQNRENVAYPIEQVLPDTPTVIVFDESPESPMLDVAYIHIDKRTVLPYCRQQKIMASKSGLATAFMMYRRARARLGNWVNRLVCMIGLEFLWYDA
jgi:hypothetical protein